MSDDKKLSYNQLAELCQHLQEFIIALTDIDNGLVRKLMASPTFQEPDRATLKEWSQVINDLHTGSEARIMDIRNASGSAGATRPN